MPFRQYVLTLSGSAQQLSTVLATAEKESHREGPSLASFSVQPNSSNANPVFFGSSAVSGSAYAVRLSSALTGEPPAPYLKEQVRGPVRLGDYWVIGTNTEKLHIGIDVE